MPVKLVDVTAADALGTNHLRTKVLNSLAWVGAARVFLEVSKIVVLVVLAHLLTPGDFGTAGMVLVFTGLAPILSGLALGSALIHKKDLTDVDRSTAFWAGLFVGGCASLAGVVLSGEVAAFFGKPEVKPLFAVFSIGFVVAGLATTQTQVLIRELSYRALQLRNMVGTAAGVAIGLTLAVLGFGPWAIVGQQLATVTCTTIMVWVVSDWRPTRQFSLQSLKRLSVFGGNVSGTLLLAEVNRNADNVLVGRFLGSTALGTYSMAYTIMLLPFSRITGPLQEVLYSAFSRVQDDALRVRVLWIRSCRLVAGVTVPALLGLIVIAPDFVPVVLGHKWAGAVPVVQVLAWAGMLQAVQGLNPAVLQARDRTGAQLRVSIVAAVLNLAAFGTGLHWGILGVAVGFAIATSISHPIYTWVTARAVNAKFSLFYREIAGVLVAAGAMAILTLSAREAMIRMGIAAGYRVLAVVFLGLTSYVLVVWFAAPEVAHEIRRLRRRNA